MRGSLRNDQEEAYQRDPVSNSPRLDSAIAVGDTVEAKSCVADAAILTG